METEMDRKEETMRIFAYFHPVFAPTIEHKMAMERTTSNGRAAC